MRWKITLWLMRRKKKYLVFVYYGKNKIWNCDKREWEWSKATPFITTRRKTIRVWDIKNNCLHSYEKQIWEESAEKDKENYYVKITGLIRI